jgi:hypothetical protein
MQTVRRESSIAARNGNLVIRSAQLKDALARDDRPSVSPRRDYCATWAHRVPDSFQKRARAGNDPDRAGNSGQGHGVGFGDVGKGGVEYALFGGIEQAQGRATPGR